MSGIKLSELATTTVLDGEELVTILQDGWNRNTSLNTIVGPINTRSLSNTSLIATNSTLITSVSSTLTTRVGELDYMLSVLQSDHSTDITDFRTEMQAITATQNAGLSIVSTDLANLTSTHNTDIANLTSTHSTDLANLLSTHNTDIASLSSVHAIDYQTLNTLNTQLSTNITSLSSAHTTDFQNLNNQLSQVNYQLSQPKVSISPVFITDITNNTGLIEKTYKADTVPNNYIIDEVTVDSSTALRVYVEWDGPDDEWMGDASINGSTISTGDIARIGTSRRFEADVEVNATGSPGITAAANGGVHVVPVVLLGGGPVITNISLSDPPTTGGYQPVMFLDGDTIQITVEFDTDDVDSVTLQGSSNYATTGEVISVSTTGTPASATFTTTIDTGATVVSNLPVKLSAKNSFGTAGPDFTSVITAPVRVGPEITNISFGAYPGSQTELKNNDTLNITVEFDTNAVSKLQFYNSGSYANDGSSPNITTTNLSATTTLKIGTSVTTVQQQSVRLRSRGTHNNWGNYTNSSGTLPVNNAYPTFAGYSVTYPANQDAIKDVESVDVALTITKQGASPTYTYSSPTGEVSITDNTVYTQTKQADCTAPGTYNISNSNYKVIVNRAENDAESTYTNNIKIADILPTFNVTYPNSRMRSGGNDGTTVQTYQIQATSNQQLRSFVMNPASTAGTFDGSWSGSSSNTVWRRNIKISDDDSKGTFSWQNMAAENLAGSVQNSISTGSSYILGGFVLRTLTVASQGWQVQANVEAVTYNKVDVAWSQKTLTTQASVGDTSRPQIASWSLDRLSPKPITVNILDSGATNASSSPTTLTIEETV